MSNVVRLVNGGTIQVRTGVIQGIGPEGPRGLRGLPGPDGEQGPQGEPGPMGQILQIQTKAIVSGTTTVTPDTDTTVAFGTVAYDDIGGATSSTNFTLTSPGDYMLSAWVGFNLPGNAGDGTRDLWFNSSISGIVARTSVSAVTDAVTYVNLAFPHRTAVSNEIITVRVRSGDDLAVGISSGAVAITRVGSGPQGPAGPAGPQGQTGATGAQGIQGPAGSAGGGYTTYAAIDGA